MKLMEPQVRGINGVQREFLNGVKRTVLCSATGGGKTVMAFDMIRRATERGKTALLLTHRKMLFDQLDSRLKEAGFLPGYRASGLPEYDSNVTLAMIQTEYDRSFKNKRSEPVLADLVIQDECHADKGKRSKTMLDYYVKNGSYVCGLSATPVGVGELYDSIVYAGLNSDLRNCGLHVPCTMYGPDEADLSDLKKSLGKYRERDLEKKFATHAVVGSVAQHWRRLNPDRRPGLVYAPSVSGSKFITEGLNNSGIKTAHLDGNNAVWNGEEIKSSKTVRDDLVDALISGKIEAISNRFVLREGIDIPQLYCASLVTKMGLVAYIQSCGRILRAHPSLDHVRIIDHGGNAREHGLIDLDRHYHITQPEHKQPSAPDKTKGWRCPKCFGMQREGGKCVNCGHVIEHRNFAILQTNGTLRQIQMEGTNEIADRFIQRQWDKLYFMFVNKRANISWNGFISAFEKKVPGCRVVSHRDRTCVLQESGRHTVLRRAPAPNTREWKVNVVKCRTRDLQ